MMIPTNMICSVMLRENGVNRLSRMMFSTI